MAMKTTRIAAIGTASLIAVMALILAAPAMASTQNTTLLTDTSVSSTSSTTSTQVIPTPTTLSVGQTITFTSISGEWHLLSGPNPAQATKSTTTTATANSVPSGPASGTMVLTVTGVYRTGYALSLTSGTIGLVTATSTGTTTITSYTLASGSAEMGPQQAHLEGQGLLAIIVPLGQSASTTPGSFLFSAGAHANFQGKTYNTLRIDLEVDGVEYEITLLVTATVS